MFHHLDGQNVPMENDPVTSKSIGYSERNTTAWPKAYYDGLLNDATYSSSDATIATVNASGNVEVKAYSGSVIISATYTFNESTTSHTSTASYTLTITDDRAEMSDAVFGFSSSTASATYGGTLENAPTLNTPSTHHLDNVEMSSSNTNVATVTFDKKTFAYSVTIVGAGSADISAVFAGDSNTKPSNAVMMVFLFIFVFYFDCKVTTIYVKKTL